MKGKIISSFILSLLLPLLVFAYTSPGKASGFVNDFAAVLSADQRAALEAKLSAFQNDTLNQIAVVTVKNLGGDTVENFAVELFKDWGIGEKGKDNGVLLLVATEEHQMRIEAGYGLEGTLTDALSSRIINNTLKPAFRAGDFYGGLSSATDQIIGVISPEYASGAGISARIAMGETPRQSGVDFSTLLFFLIFAPIWLASILGRSKSWWAGGVLGGIAGVVVGFIFGFFYLGIAAILLFIPSGLLFDFFVSRSYASRISRGLPLPWWIGGGRGGRGGGMFGGGGFGGFGGGGSGGGGASGSW